MINCFTKVDMDSVVINPENSVWELDGHDGKLHGDLPPIEERKNYFPRVNTGIRIVVSRLTCRKREPTFSGDAIRR